MRTHAYTFVFSFHVSHVSQDSHSDEITRGRNLQIDGTDDGTDGTLGTDTDSVSQKGSGMATMIKAIETVYKGYRFRSRLEARWAVFFDALGIKWEYEHEGYDLGDAGWYLPDFWLPTFESKKGMWVEVKPDGGDFSLAREFVKQTTSSIWLAEGVPSNRAWLVYQYSIDDNGEIDCYEWPGIPNADQAASENRMFSCPGYENKDLTIPDQYLGCLGSRFIQAVNAARSARFEHGESGAR